MENKKEGITFDEAVEILTKDIRKIVESSGDILSEDKKLAPNKTYKVKGEVLNNVIAYLEHLEDIRVDISTLAGAFQELSVKANLNILSIEKIMLGEYISQHKKSLLN